MKKVDKFLQFIYNDDEIIDFSTNGNSNVMVNATQMAKVFDRRIDPFLRSDHARNFILELEKYFENEIILTPNGVRIKQKAVEYLYNN